MEKVPLGDTGLEVSRLSLGTVKIGRNQAVKYPEGFEIPDDEAVIALLKCAQKNGINMLDTAPAYGESERRLGELLPQVGGRNEWIIVGKVGENFENGQSSYDFSAKAIEESVNQSLKRLNTDYLDVVLVHSDGGEIETTAHLEAFPTLQKLKEQGKIRAFGMSSKTVEGGLLTLEYADVVMVMFHENYNDEYPVIAEAIKKNKGVLVKKAFGSGHLSDKESALKFVLREEGVSSVVIGTINIAHLEANCAVAEACVLKKS